MKRNPLSLVLGSMVVVLTVSVGVNSVNAQDQLLRWKLKEGQQFKVVMTQNMKQSMTGGPQAIEMPMEMKFSMSWKVDQADTESFKMTQTIDRIQMQVTSPFMDISLDTESDEAPEGIAAQIYQTIEPLLGAEITLTMNSRGEISNVEFPKGALEGLANNAMTQQFSSEGIKQMIAQSSVVLPENAIQKGATWTTNFGQDSAMGKMNFENTYRYDGLEEVDGKTVDKIHISTKVSFPESGGITTLKDQDSSGYLYFDNSAGYLMGSKINQKMELEIEAGGQQLTQSITGEIDMKIIPQ